MAHECRSRWFIRLKAVATPATQPLHFCEAVFVYRDVENPHGLKQAEMNLEDSPNVCASDRYQPRFRFPEHATDARITLDSAAITGDGKPAAKAVGWKELQIPV
jgi:hypothetical protein